MIATLVLGLAFVAPSGLLVLIIRQERVTQVQSVGLRFGGDVTADTVIALLTQLSGLPWNQPVVLEVSASTQGIVHRLHARAGTVELLRAQLRGMLPSLRFETLSQQYTAPAWPFGRRLRWAGAHPVLQTDQARETAAALLGALADLQRGEALSLCWVLSAARRPILPQRERREHQGGGWLSTRQPSIEHLRALRQKYGGPVLKGRAVLLVQSHSRPRAQQLTGRITTVLRSRHSSWGRLSVRPQRPLPAPQLLGSWQRHSYFSPLELAGLVGWPIDAPRVPGLALHSSPQLMPSPRLPKTGRVFARSDWPGMEQRRLVQPVVGGLSHGLIVGPTGSGKSHLLANLITQDIAAGRGCLVLDGKGDLAREVLTHIPAARQSDVIVLDPGAGLPLPGLRVFARGGDAELTADVMLGVFRDLFADSWGIRSDKWLRAGLVTLAHDPQGTLANLPFLFSNPGYRRQLVGRLRDPLLLDTWAAFEAMSPAEQSQQLGSPLTKVSELIGRRVVRGVLAQPEPTLDLSAVLRKRQVVVVALSAGTIGTPAARLLGALIVHGLFQAVQARAAVSPDKRRPFFAYIDEPKVLGDLPVPLDSLFELARGLGVGLTIGAQSLTQLSKPVSQAALTNAATIVAFKQAADDARLLARELLSLTAEDLQGLGRFEVAARLGLGPGDVAPVATGVTLPLPASVSDPQAVRQVSAEAYGQNLEAVDQALRERYGLSHHHPSQTPRSAGPVGRLRRPS